jgi:hypothetical protein
VTLDVLDVVQLGCERVLYVDDDDFPVGLALVEESHDAQDFDLLDLPDVTHLFADLAYVQWVVVTPGLGLCVLLIGILPSLKKNNIRVSMITEPRGEVENDEVSSERGSELADLREGTIVPDVAVVREAVAHVAQATLLDVLFDGVERLLLGDFHLGVGPAGNLDDHVEYAIALIGEKRDVVERGDDLAILLDVDAMFWSSIIALSAIAIAFTFLEEDTYRGCSEHR